MDRTDPALLRAPNAAPKDSGAETDAHAHAAFLATHAEIWPKITDKPLSALPLATAEALWEARARALKVRAGKLVTVSAWTAAGKTKGALALAVHLARQGKAVAIALPEISLIEEQRKDLLDKIKVPPHWVAVESSLHRKGRDPQLVAAYRDVGVEVGEEYTYSADDHRNARILLCTHEAWVRELKASKHRRSWVYTWAEGPRELVIVDEEPKDTATYDFGIADVARLQELLGTTVLQHERRAHGITSEHPAAAAVRSILRKMGRITDTTVKQGLIQPVTELVTHEELESIESIETSELRQRIHMTHAVSPAELREVVAEIDGVIAALKAAGAGRVFFGRSGPEGNNGARFFAYDLRVRVPQRTICLDGTVDLDNIRAAELDVVVPQGPVTPSYGGSTMHLVNLPKSMRDSMPRRDKQVLHGSIRNNVFLPLRRYILEHTSPGDRVLVYWKKALQYSDFPGTRKGDENHSTWEGRTVYFTSFGADKGTNRYQDCNVYIQLGHLYLPRSVYVARLGAATGEVLSPEYLKQLAKPNVKDPVLAEAKRTHVLVRTKQDTARVLRGFDEFGVCAPRELHFISGETDRLAAWANRLFPGAAVRRERLGLEGELEDSDKRSTGSTKLARALVEASESELTIRQLLDHTGIQKGVLKRTLAADVVQDAMTAGGWKYVALSKGWKLVRAVP